LKRWQNYRSDPSLGPDRLDEFQFSSIGFWENGQALCGAAIACE